MDRGAIAMDRVTRAKRRSRLLLLAVAGAAVLVLAGCGSQQDTLHPHSHQAREISGLFWNMMIGSWIGIAIVAVILIAAWRLRGKQGLPGFGSGDKVSNIVVLAGGIVVPIIVIVVLFVISDIFIIRDTQAPAAAKTSLTIHVTGHQWFWEIQYPGTKAVTANELHIPVRTAVDLEVTTADVIHSFWVPELNRKIDTIPGQVNRIELYADKPGRFRGQCAEFCGLQHAHMSMYVYAQPPAQFRAWLANEAAPAPAPTTASERQGEHVFVDGPCSSCHTIRGTTAKGFVGPDLTHLADRHTLGALTIPNRRGYLGGWILDSQHVKPGNQMPDLNLTGPQLQSLLDYLESLK